MSEALLKKLQISVGSFW